MSGETLKDDQSVYKQLSRDARPRSVEKPPADAAAADDAAIVAAAAVAAVVVVLTNGNLSHLRARCCC